MQVLEQSLWSLTGHRMYDQSCPFYPLTESRAVYSSESDMSELCIVHLAITLNFWKL